MHAWYTKSHINILREWYDEHYAALVEGINTPIRQLSTPTNKNAYLVLPDESFNDGKTFAVAVNGIGQPTIVAGIYGEAEVSVRPIPSQQGTLNRAVLICCY